MHNIAYWTLEWYRMTHISIGTFSYLHENNSAIVSYMQADPRACEAAKCEREITHYQSRVLALCAPPCLQCGNIPPHVDHSNDCMRNNIHRHNVLWESITGTRTKRPFLCWKSLLSSVYSNVMNFVGSHECWRMWRRSSTSSQRY